MPTVKLTELKSISDFWRLRFVRVQPEQWRFTKHPLLTYLQSRHPAVTTYSVQWQEELVGYVMLIHAENPTQWIIERLTINGAHQRQGLAYAVADQLIDMIYGFENSEMVIARYKPENEAARKLFEKLRFVEREEMFRGRHIALLEFEFEDDEAEDDDYEEDDYEGDDYEEEEDYEDDDYEGDDYEEDDYEEDDYEEDDYEEDDYEEDDYEEDDYEEDDYEEDDLADAKSEKVAKDG